MDISIEYVGRKVNGIKCRKYFNQENGDYYFINMITRDETRRKHGAMADCGEAAERNSRESNEIMLTFTSLHMLATRASHRLQTERKTALSSPNWLLSPNSDQTLRISAVCFWPIR